ncbi:hypothetical protein FOA52_009564 [Chlamydomonas sp. UWO 241]|nr:hypothetical protein FOA52_009564 [Chlamydomonas sp. UWO 241]
MCSQAGGDAAQALLFAAEACHKRCGVPLVDLLRAHLNNVSKKVQPRQAELVLEAVADLEVWDLATQSDSTGADAQQLHLDPRQLYEAAARSAGVAVSGSSTGVTSVGPSASTVLDLLTVCDAAQMPLEAVQLALSVLDDKLPLDRSSSSERSGGGGAEPEAEPLLDEQSVATEAMAIANGSGFFLGSLTVLRYCGAARAA